MIVKLFTEFIGYTNVFMFLIGNRGTAQKVINIFCIYC